jgi:hypothetical protein
LIKKNALNVELVEAVEVECLPNPQEEQKVMEQ